MRRCTERATRSLAFALAAVAALASTDCSRDHDALAARPRPEGGSAGKAGAAGASSGSGGVGGSFGGRAGSGSGGTGGTGGKVAEQPGRSVVTFVNAVVDAPIVALCFAKNGGGENALVGRPRPAAGLAYGAALVLETLSGVDLDAESVVPYALAGDLTVVDGSSCKEAVALAEAEMRAANGAGGGAREAGAGGEGGSGAGGEGGNGGRGAPRLRVARLPELAPGSFTQGFSLLYAMVGCLGGPTFTHEEEEALCGDGYAPNRPTASAELVVLSRRVGISTVAIQALHASRSLPAVDLRVRPPDNAVEPWAYIADNVMEGMLRPREPRLDLAPAGYGVGTRTWRVQALVNGFAVVSDSWPTIKRRSGLDDPTIGRGYTLILMGPSMVVEDAASWNPPGFTMVDNDPMLP